MQLNRVRKLSNIDVLRSFTGCEHGLTLRSTHGLTRPWAGSILSALAAALVYALENFVSYLRPRSLYDLRL